MKMLLRDFNAKVGSDDIFKSTFRTECIHKISNDNGVTVANFATSKSLTVEGTMFTHCNIHKYTGMFPDGKPHNQIGQH
jgi:hypothetical protein